MDDDEPPGVPEWVVTYGDMMSLLLTFFIMLVSMSELKQEGKVRAMLDALQERFGVGMGKMGAPGPSSQRLGMFPKHSSDGNTSEGGMKKSGRKSGGPAGPHTTVDRVAHGSVITIGGPTTFARGQTDLTPEIEGVLDGLVDVLTGKPNKLVVRGHAAPDDIALDDGGLDPIAISILRARNVATYLAANGIDRRRMVVSGAGTMEPFVVTRDDDQRQQNRRVDVFVIDSYTTPRATQDEEATSTDVRPAASDERATSGETLAPMP